MTNSTMKTNFNSESSSKLLRQHAIEAKLAGRFMEVSPSEIIFLLDKLESLEKELEIERMLVVACGVAAQGHFTGCLREYRSASLDDVLQLRKEYESSLKRGEENALEHEEQKKYGHWIINTGTRAVPANTPIEVSLQDGTVQTGRANEFHWGIFGSRGDIIRYRVILNKD